MSIRIAGLFGLFALIGAAATAADTAPAPSSGTSNSVPTYITVGDITGEIAKVDSTSITIRVSWIAPPPKLSKNATPQQRQNAQKSSGPQHKDYVMNFTVDA